MFIVEDFTTEDSMQQVADLSLDSDDGSSVQASEQSLSTVPIEDEHSFSEMTERSSLSTVQTEEDHQSFSEMTGTITSYLMKMADLYQVQEFHDLSLRFEELIKKFDKKTI